ncbi:MAG: copper chaperone PCu(A)C [bacterium]
MFKKTATGLLIVLFAACSSSTTPEIKAQNAWSWPVEAMLTDQGTSHSTGVVYLTLVNDGGSADRLLGARSDVAEVVEFHETRTQGDRMRMQMVKDGIDLLPHSQLHFKPGGLHMMLIGLRRSLNAGDKFKVVLKFAKSGMITVESEVRQP